HGEVALRLEHLGARLQLLGALAGVGLGGVPRLVRLVFRDSVLDGLARLCRHGRLLDEHQLQLLEAQPHLVAPRVLRLEEGPDVGGFDIAGRRILGGVAAPQATDGEQDGQYADVHGDQPVAVLAVALAATLDNVLERHGTPPTRTKSPSSPYTM